MAHKTLAEMKARLMQRDDFQAAYEAEARKERLQALLAEWRSHAGLNSADVAARMGIAPPRSHVWKKTLRQPALRIFLNTREHVA